MITSMGSFLAVRSFGYRYAITTTTNAFAVTRAVSAAVATSTTVRWLSVNRNLGDESSKQDQVLLVAQEEIDSLAVTGRTWKRLGPVVSLATTTTSSSSSSSSEMMASSAHTTTTTTASATAASTRRRGTVVADIGCDHGLLTFGLAATCRFERVIGVDVSHQALQHGGWALLEERQQQQQQLDESKDDNDKMSKIEFVLGNGLQPILDQQIDTICMAGLGVNTMQLISEPTALDRVACQRIVVQPVNSRPRQLMQLYTHLVENCGFSVEKEHISFLSNRWYVSTLFQRRSTPSTLLTVEDKPFIPGRLLEQSDDEQQRRIHSLYVEHHIAWLRKDSLSKKHVFDPRDQTWLAAVGGM